MARWWSHTLYIYSKKIDISVDYNCEYLVIYPLTVAISTKLHVFLAEAPSYVTTNSALGE